MENKNEVTTKVSENESKHNHAGHMKMMVICCGIPVVGFLAIAALGIEAPSLETLLALACPVGMGVMMYMMRKKSEPQGQTTTETSGLPFKTESCCSTETKAPKVMPQDLSLQKLASDGRSADKTAPNENHHLSQPVGESNNQ